MLDGRRYLVRGRVQGVSFRYFTLQVARELGIVGWVRNRSDGSVEIAAAARPDDLQAFAERLHLGPRLARVEAVEVEPVAIDDNWSTFEIRY